MSGAVQTGFQIRPMRLEDVPRVHEIDRLSFPLPWPERSYRFEIRENEHSSPWVVETVLPDGRAEVVAMMVNWVIIDEAHIATIAVHPDYRRRKIAQRLLAWGLRAAEERGARTAFLEVRCGNLAAQAMYAAFGFEIVGERPRYYQDNQEDAILMTLPQIDRPDLGLGRCRGTGTLEQQEGGVDAKQTLAEIAGQVAARTRCQLHYSRKKAVPGEGPSDAEVMLIGEGPGFYEKRTGPPLRGSRREIPGRAAREGRGEARDGLYHERGQAPPAGEPRPPARGALLLQRLSRPPVSAINPKVIVTLGRYSMGKFMPNARISEVHGQPSWNKGRLIIPMYHPAAALHQPSLKTTLERGFARLTDFIKQAKQTA